MLTAKNTSLFDYLERKKTDIPIDIEKERILKELIDGDTVYEIVLHDSLPEHVK